MFTIIGTISHELGHLTVARLLGYSTTLHFGSLGYDNSKLNRELDSIYLRNQYAIDHDLEYEEKEDFDRKYDKLVTDDLKVLLGGPLQTMLTGFIAFLFLLFRKKKVKKNGLKIIDWLLVFLSLFWLREIFNFITSIITGLLFENESFFGGDEMYISKYYNLGPGTIPLITAIIGTAICLYVIFKIVPKYMQRTFIIAGFSGGIVGFGLWFYLVGPILLP